MRKEPKTSGDRRKPPVPPGIGIDTMQMPAPKDRNVQLKLSLIQKMMKWVKDRKLISDIKKAIR